MRLPRLLCALPLVVSASPAFAADSPAGAANDLCIALGVAKPEICGCVADTWDKRLPVWDEFILAYAEYYGKKGANAPNWQNDLAQILGVDPQSIDQFYDSMIVEMKETAEACS